MTTTNPKFAPGRVVATPAALGELAGAGQTPQEFLHRHLSGDWGDLSPEDAALNDEALTDGSRIFSAYRLRTGETIWVITEAVGDDGRRASTCCLRPDDY